MTTLDQAVRSQRRRRWRWFFIILFLVIFLQILFSAHVRQFYYLTKAPKLPDAVEYENIVYLSGLQNWDHDPDNPNMVGPVTHEYHHKSQGTSTFPVPAQWMLALEAPSANMFTVPFSRREKFMSNENLTRYGFIPSEKSAINPDGLPIGIARTRFETMDGVANKADALGFSCAACHTGQIKHGDTLYVVEGGPATVDIGAAILGGQAALGQTILSSFIPIFNGRWERFVDDALGPDANNPENVARLKDQLLDVALYNFLQPAQVNVTEGFTRLDALNRIGNRVFAWDAERNQNYAAPDAPVNFPHIWTTSWFKWVQYDASIMQPLIRNTGEAMGVYANVNMNAPLDDARFSSSIPVDNLVWMEHWLGGSNPTEEQEFNGLWGPEWPEEFPPVDLALATRGEVLYKELCIRCHLPPINGQLTDSNGIPVNGPNFFEGTIWDHFEPIVWFDEFGTRHESERVLDITIVPTTEIGTDPATGEVLEFRTVNTAGYSEGNVLVDTDGMHIDELICSWEPPPPPNPWDQINPSANASTQEPRLVTIRVADNPNELYALSLGAVVQAVNNEWFRQKDYSPELIQQVEGTRPNCLQAGVGYKARPHDGVWSTAPFLHNGSVPTLFDLLSPVEERPELVLLGNPEFDPVNVGLAQPERLIHDPDDLYANDGYFLLDTSTPGNRNIGHEFNGDGELSDGVIGRYLSETERYELIEYLKTL